MRRLDPRNEVPRCAATVSRATSEDRRGPRRRHREEIGTALAALSGAYELLDERTADRLEDELFGPVQVAYGRARRTHTAFAERYGLPTRTFSPAVQGAPSHGVRGFLDMAVESVAGADDTLAELQDSMLPVEVGDAELRAGLAEVRELVGALPRPSAGTGPHARPLSARD